MLHIGPEDRADVSITIKQAKGAHDLQIGSQICILIKCQGQGSITQSVWDRNPCTSSLGTSESCLISFSAVFWDDYIALYLFLLSLPTHLVFPAAKPNKQTHNKLTHTNIQTFISDILVTANMPITSYQPAEQQSDEQQQDYRRHQSQENYGAVLKLPQRLDMVAMPMPPLKDGYVQVQMKTVSVSDADVRLWKNGSTPSLLGGSDSVVLGCEGAGVVTAVGAHVHNLRVGDRVVVEP